MQWLLAINHDKLALLYDYPKYAIVIGPTCVTWYVKIITFDQWGGAAVNYRSLLTSGAGQRSKVPVTFDRRDGAAVKSTAAHQLYILHCVMLTS